MNFLSGLKNGAKMIAIVAPSAAANFPELYLNLNGWLKSLGVKGIFDVSFGAELAARSYVRLIEEENPQTVIAQPCAAIQTFIQLYHPELIQYLAPVDSPMLHTIKMIREYYPQYRDHEIAVISPCGAKKREFEETGFGDYNIAYQSIDNYLNSNNIDISYFPHTKFDNPPAERAVLFSTPGGLLETVQRAYPDLQNSTRKIEGVGLVYDYLKNLPQMIKQQISPQLVDCLSCEFGCNAGPLTLNTSKSPDEIEFWINRRNAEVRQFYQNQTDGHTGSAILNIEEVIDSYWQEGMYKREYRNLWENNTLNYPTAKQLKEVFTRMYKYSDKDIINCNSCGYGSCEMMATAIFNDLNRVENCHFYLMAEEQNSRKELEKSRTFFSSLIETSVEGFVQIDTDGYICRANPAVKNMLKRNDLIGRKLSEFTDEIGVINLEKQLQIRQRHLHSTYELNLIQSDGNKIYCQFKGSPLMEEGHFIGSFAMITDITDLKRAQENLSHMNEILEEKVKDRTLKLEEALEEMNQQTNKIMSINETLHQQKETLEATLSDLNIAKVKLVQSEKMASLGEVTAGIAHEIQNPLNFVNNFADITQELITDMIDKIENRDLEEAKAIAMDIERNAGKILAHGRRADAIVKNMLQHSRESSGEKEPTDINFLADEYMRLAYHGLRAKDKSFNARMKTNFDPTVEKVVLVPHEIGRVILNLVNNAFYAVTEKKNQLIEIQSPDSDTYEPTVFVSTRNLGNSVEIRIGDNGNGIPVHLQDKIFQPFFTTKPAGKGTGLGLSLCYDIVTKGHGGEIRFERREEEGTDFLIRLNVINQES
jgi:PAS domain S-box-containing protein